MQREIKCRLDRRETESESKPVEGPGHAHSRLDGEGLGIPLAGILFRLLSNLLLLILLLRLGATVFVLMFLLLLPLFSLHLLRSEL